MLYARRMAQELAGTSSTAVSDEGERPPDAVRAGRALLERARIEAEAPDLIRALRAGFPAIAKVGTAEAADLLCELAAEPRLAEWRETGGPTLRTRATEALLSMGYPFALQVAPEALEQARRETEGRGTAKRSTGWVLAMLAAALTLVAGPMGFPMPQAESWLLLALFAVATVLATREDGNTVWLGVPLLGILGIVEIATAAIFTSTHGAHGDVWLGVELLIGAGASALGSALLLLSAWAADFRPPKGHA